MILFKTKIDDLSATSSYNGEKTPMGATLTLCLPPLVRLRDVVYVGLKYHNSKFLFVSCVFCKTVKLTHERTIYGQYTRLYTINGIAAAK